MGVLTKVYGRLMQCMETEHANRSSSSDAITYLARLFIMYHQPEKRVEQLN